MQPRKSVYRVYSSSRALREHLKSCSRRDGSTSNGRIDHVFQIWFPPSLLPSHSPCRDSSPRTFPVRPPGGRRSIPNRSIRALRVTSGGGRGMRYFTLPAGPELTCLTTKWTVTLAPLLLLLLPVCFVLT